MKPMLRISGARIATLVGEDDPLDATDLWIADGRIAALSPAGSPPPGEGPVEEWPLHDALVMPGLVNAHSHSYATLLRGSVAGAPLDLFVMEAMARRAPRPLRQVEVAVLLQSVEMLKNGITGVVDHFRHGAVPSVEAVCAAFAAYARAGVRAAIAPMYEDRIYLDSMPIDPADLPAAVRSRWAAMRPAPMDEYFAMMEEVVAEWHGRGRSQVMLGVDGPQRCTPDLLERTGQFAARHAIGLHTHLLEAKTQHLMAPAECHGSFVEYLDRYGLIGPRSALAHFVWCTDRDIALAAERRVNVVHNPVSNLLLGSGLQPAARLLRAGISVALGCDSASCTSLSIFEQAKYAMLLSRVSEVDPDRWITARQALRMACTNGGHVLGGSCGTIEIGAHADLAIIDLNRPAYRPMGDIWNHLVLYETGANVAHVLVGGEVVVRDGRCTRVDEAELLAEADALAVADRHANAASVGVTQAERPAFQPLILDALRQQAPIERFVQLR